MNYYHFQTILIPLREENFDSIQSYSNVLVIDHIMFMPRGGVPHVFLAFVVVVMCFLAMACGDAALWPSWKCVGCRAGAEALRLLYEVIMGANSRGKN